MKKPHTTTSPPPKSGEGMGRFQDSGRGGLRVSKGKDIDRILGFLIGTMAGTVLGGPVGALAGGAVGFFMSKGGVFGEWDPDPITPGDLVGTAASSLLGHQLGKVGGSGVLGEAVSVGVEGVAGEPISRLADRAIEGVIDSVLALVYMPRIMATERRLEQKLRDSKRKEPAERLFDDIVSEMLGLLRAAGQRMPVGAKTGLLDAMTAEEHARYDELEQALHKVAKVVCSRFHDSKR
jgi:hypothetical protein